MDCCVHVEVKEPSCDAFVKYKAEAENNTRNKIKVVKSDRGGEFLANAF